MSSSPIEEILINLAEKRYGVPLQDTVRDRIITETKAFEESGSMWKFLKMREFMDKCKVDSDSIMLLGTMAGSIISYILGISAIDPVYYNLCPEMVTGLDKPKSLNFYFALPKEKLNKAERFFNAKCLRG